MQGHQLGVGAAEAIALGALMITQGHKRRLAQHACIPCCLAGLSARVAVTMPMTADMHAKIHNPCHPHPPTRYACLRGWGWGGLPKNPNLDKLSALSGGSH